MIIEVTYHPSKHDLESIYQALKEFNEPFFPGLDEKVLALFIRDQHHQIIGGIAAHLFYDSLHIHRIWVNEAYRRKGVGTKLLKTAEKEARKMQVKKVFLDTYNFQAPDFYLKHGFHEVGRYVGYPQDGTDKIFYRKTLI
ncbi:GNAT family N-acetyltransferase [Vibrio penaeicida]|uniref:GNAT family N-acetyltransferase n=1 Tax=Vibrio penaeicida TaxID=104609 RepID=UPI00273241F3|nr:GNAT family N-acetyltransferase [Vibrio penaeicida]MDP2574505.1 GNAT family N-acetyltransferase [Vibrio penaeicida]